mgnify:CR=1 FL=1
MALRFSGPFRVMQRPELRSVTKVNGGRARADWCVASRKKARRRRRRMKGDSMVLFIGLEVQMAGTGIEEAVKWICDGTGASIFGGSVKKEIY